MRDLRGENLTPAVQYDLVLAYYEPIFEKIYYDDYPKRKKELEQLQALVAGYGDLQSLVDDTALDPPESGQDRPAPLTRAACWSCPPSTRPRDWNGTRSLSSAWPRAVSPTRMRCPAGQWEEERRLLYVAATRAKKKLYLTYPQELVNPDRSVLRTVMSPFVREINPGLYERLPGRARPLTPPSRQLRPLGLLLRRSGREGMPDGELGVGIDRQTPLFRPRSGQEPARTASGGGGL